MLEPLVIPRSIIERFLEKALPDFAEMWSMMRTEKEGDGFSPKLRQTLANLKVSKWAQLYSDPENEIKAKLLFVMRPEEINALNADLKAMSVQEQSEWLASEIRDATEDDFKIDEVAELTKEQFAALSEEIRAQFVRDCQRFFGFFIPMFLNFMSRMVHRKSLISVGIDLPLEINVYFICRASVTLDEIRDSFQNSLVYLNRFQK